MIGGVGFPSLLPYATNVTGTAADANYPLLNALSIANPNRPVIAAAAGAFTIRVVLDEPRAMDFLALVATNVLDGTLRVRVFATTNILTGVLNYDSGVISFWPSSVSADASYTLTRPFKLPSTITGQTIVFDIAPATSTVVKIGAIEVSGWWSWPDISVSEERGFLPRTVVSALPGGIDATTRQWAPRIQSGTRAALTSEELETTAIDFQRAMGRSKPFVFVRDVADSTRWLRETFLAKNADVPALPIDDTEVGAFSYRLREHIG